MARKGGSLLLILLIIGLAVVVIYATGVFGETVKAQQPIVVPLAVTFSDTGKLLKTGQYAALTWSSSATGDVAVILDPDGDLATTPNIGVLYTNGSYYVAHTEFDSSLNSTVIVAEFKLSAAPEKIKYLRGGSVVFIVAGAEEAKISRFGGEDLKVLASSGVTVEVKTDYMLGLDWKVIAIVMAAVAGIFLLIFLAGGKNVRVGTTTVFSMLIIIGLIGVFVALIVAQGYTDATTMAFIMAALAFAGFIGPMLLGRFRRSS